LGPKNAGPRLSPPWFFNLVLFPKFFPPCRGLGGFCPFFVFGREGGFGEFLIKTAPPLRQPRLMGLKQYPKGGRFEPIGVFKKKKDYQKHPMKFKMCGLGAQNRARENWGHFSRAKPKGARLRHKNPLLGVSKKKGWLCDERHKKKNKKKAGCPLLIFGRVVIKKFSKKSGTRRAPKALFVLGNYKFCPGQPILSLLLPSVRGARVAVLVLKKKKKWPEQDPRRRLAGFLGHRVPRGENRAKNFQLRKVIFSKKKKTQRPEVQEFWLW